MADGVAVVLEFLAELAGQLGDVREAAGEEAPMGGIVMVAAGVILEDGGGIVGGIEGDGEKVPIGGRAGGGGQGFLDAGEVIREKGAGGREGASCKEECEGDDLALGVAESDGLAQFVGEMVVGKAVTDGERSDGAGDLEFWRRDGGKRRSGGGLGIAQDGDVLNPAIVAGDHEVEGDEIAGLEAGEVLWVFDAKLHGHGAHVVGDGVVLDGEGFAVECDGFDGALGGVVVGGFGGVGGLVTGGEKEN